MIRFLLGNPMRLSVGRAVAFSTLVSTAAARAASDSRASSYDGAGEAVEWFGNVVVFGGFGLLFALFACCVVLSLMADRRQRVADSVISRFTRRSALSPTTGDTSEK